jgi:hypothetical protein
LWKSGFNEDKEETLSAGQKKGPGPILLGEASQKSGGGYPTLMRSSEKFILKLLAERRQGAISLWMRRKAFKTTNPDDQSRRDDGQDI